MYAIEQISTQELRAAEGHDGAGWNTLDSQRGIDYADYASVARGVDLLELDEPGRYAFRIIERASDEQSYTELEAENIDALEALTAWVEAGCPRSGNEIEALRRAAIHRDDAAPIKVVAVPVNTPTKSEAA